MRGKKTHKLLSILLVAALLLTMLPTTALAAITMGTKPADGTTTDNPFVKGTGGSNSFRIPALVTLNDGTLVAAADARWNTTYDGGGLDTIVSYSTDNGANWNYTFANYLGDNGNTYDGSGSTAFIDPCLATDGSTVYMLCDLYPYGVALTGSGNTEPSTAVGFNSDGTLKLAASGSSTYNYYLKDGQIYDSSNNVVSSYTVDAYFNITGNGCDTNLFFSDSPYQVVRTGYLYLTKSTDGGKTWSAPTLISNVKTSSEQVCLVGPGRGLVTGGKIIFPVYSYNNGSQQMGFIYSSDGGTTWTRSANFTGDSWSSESAVVELSDGTLRFFYRNDNSKLYYVDYTSGTGWGSAVNTGIATNSNTQISAIALQNTVDGKQVILVSCPTGSNNAGSADSSATARLNGRIQIGLVDSDKTVDWKTPIDVTTNNSQFMYSCLTELNNGKIAILYENNQSAWGTGDNCYYTMDFKTYDLGLTFDPIVNENIFVDNETNITINFGETVVNDSAVTIIKEDNLEALSGKDYVAYDITVKDFSGEATVTIPLNSKFGAEAKLYAVYIDDNGAITDETITGKYDNTNDTFTFTAKHFSTYAVLEAENELPEYTDTKNIILTVGEVKAEKDETGNHEDTYTGAGLNTNIATVVVKGATTEDTPAVPERTDKVTSLTAGTYIIGNGTQWLTLDGTTLGYTTEASQATQWTIAASGSSYYWTIKSGNYYLSHSTDSAGLYVSSTSSTWIYKAGTGFYYSIHHWGNFSKEYYLRWNNNNSKWEASTTKSNNGAAYTYTPGQDAVEGSAYTEITFTGVSAGETQVVVGNTLYKITVNRKTQTVNLTVDGTATFADASTSAPEVADSTIASATLTNGTLTIKGLKEGTTTVTTSTTVYTVTVSDGTSISIKENETTTISVDLASDQTVEWSSADDSYVGVAGKYDTSNKKYTNEAILAGQNVTDSPVTVTATIKDADGNVVGTQKWLVTVTEGDADTNTSSKGIYFNIDTIEHCTVYYSINGGELIPVNGTGVTTGNWTGNGTYKGHFNIMFFAAPDEGYALTYMSISGSADQYYTLTNGNPDGTGSDAWPFVDPAQTTVPTSNSDATVWKTVDRKLHGFRWSLLEGNMTIDQMKVLFSNAIALGCDGATTITKNSTEGMGSASSPTVCKFVAQKLPTVEKTIKSITHNGTETPYTDGMKVELSDTINYSVVVTRYATNATYGTITYDNEKLTDELTNNNGIFNPDMGTSTTSVKTYPYTTSLTLTMDNFASVVKDGKITNTADFSYSYSSQYSAGSLTSEASAVADITVSVPEYVIDFGLPVKIDLHEELGGANIESGTATYGTITANGTSFTYTPNKVLPDVDHVTLKLANGQSYGVNIYPASNVLYEDTFLTENKEKGGIKRWEKEGTSESKTQSAAQNTLYGYDGAYETSVGNSYGTYWTVSVPDSSNYSKYLTTSFYGNGFDLIGTAGPDTGMVYLLIQGPQNKLIVIDTSYVDNNTTLHQVPLAHEMLTEGTYTVNIRAAYRAATETNAASAASYSARSTMSASSDAVSDVYAMVDELFMDGFEIDDVEFVYFDENSPLAELDNATAAVAAYSLDTEVNAYSDDTDTTITTEPRPAGTTVTIDGFRVYRSSNNTAYLDAEQGVTYVNVLKAALDGNGTFRAYVENTDGGDWTQSTYEANGGPQNEVYLGGNDAIAFKVGTTTTTVQISARAVGTDQVKLIVNGSEIKAIDSNTEMYYSVTSDESGIITIKNTGNGLLALGNLKLPAGASTMTLTADDEPIVFSLLRMAPTSAEPEPDPVFTPAKLDVKVKSLGVIRNKVVTVTVTASTDVAKLTINGKVVKPTNSLMVKYGLSKNYTYVFTETLKKSESKDYVIVAYDENGVASEPVTVHD